MAVLATNRSGHIAALDGLRFVAAYMVFVEHFSNTTGVFGSLLGKGGGGQIGVMLFFLLSGFLMGHLYLPLPFNGLNVKRFAVNRVARVVPLFLLIVLASYMATRWGHPEYVYAIDDKALVNHLFLLKGISVLWTIPIEMQFYAAFVALWFAYSKDQAATVVGVCGLIFAAFFFYPANRIDWPLLHFGHYLLAGVLMAVMLPKVEAQLAKLPWGSRLSDLGFVLCPILIVLSFQPIHKRLFGFDLLGAGWGEMQVMLICSVFLISATQSRISTYLFGLSGLTFGGAISYSIYLIHMPLMYEVGRIVGLANILTMFIVSNIAIALIAATSYYVVELPSRRQIRRWFAAKPVFTPPKPEIPFAPGEATVNP